MIDTHCHILPLVDDGPKSLEESIKMLKMAEKDGIKTMIATPHKRHPIDFGPEYTSDQAYDLLAKEVKKQKISLKIIKGAELYIGSNYMINLDSDLENYSLGKSRYVLIEFDRDINFQNIENAIHEILIRKKTPIIAHTEMYNCFLDKTDNVYKLRNQGALVQLTAASIEGRRGKVRANFCMELIKKGAADMVATDCHGAERRKPVLSSTYKLIAEAVDQKLADRIFIDNPQLLIEDQEIRIKQIAYKKPLKSSQKRKVSLFAVTLVASLLLTGIGLSANHKDSNSKITSGLSRGKEATIEQDIEKSDKKTQEKDQAKEPVKKLEKQDSQAEKLDSQLIVQIESGYYKRLRDLEGQYMGRADEVVANIKYAIDNIKDPSLKEATIEGYKEEVFGLIDQCDNEVYAVLYDMQNELEDLQADISKVQQYRDEYNEAKATKQSQYISKLGY